MQADHMPPDANLLLHEVTRGAAPFLAAYEHEGLVSCSCCVRREGGQEREVVTKEQERPGQAGSRTPVRSWGLS